MIGRYSLFKLYRFQIHQNNDAILITAQNLTQVSVAKESSIFFTFYIFKFQVNLFFVDVTLSK